MGKGVHELRLKDRSGIYRVVYFMRKQSEILLIHAFQKKSQQTPKARPVQLLIGAELIDNWIKKIGAPEL